MRAGIQHAIILKSQDHLRFEFGDLEALHPAETFNEIKERRTRNYTLLKKYLETGTNTCKLPGGKRLEVYIPPGSVIASSVLTLMGEGTSTEVVVYPFVPDADIAAGIFINARYGDTHNFSDITIKSHVKNNFHETYSCILKPGGVTNAIEILGTPRAGFWTDLTPGKTVFYGWTFDVLGEQKVIDSIDEPNSTIYLTTNISGAVAADTVGADVNFGTSFRQDIPEADYLTYGRAWILNTGFESNRLIYGIPVADTGADYTINVERTRFENTTVQILVSMGNFKMNFEDVEFYRGNTPLAAFSRDLANGQSITSYGLLKVEEAGDLVAGSPAIFEPSGNYGAGGYIHDNVIVKVYGTLHLKNNTSASWRQYSSSYSPANAGFNYYANIIEEGSIEYGMLCSNTVPTVIDNAEFEGSLLIRHDTTINAGDIASISSQFTDFGIGELHLELNDIKLRGPVFIQGYYTGNMNNCEYILPPASFHAGVTMINPSRTLNINGGIVKNSGGIATWNPVVAGVEGARLLFPGELAKNNGSFININGLVWDEYLSHYFFSDNGVQTPYVEKDYDIQVNNCDIKALAFAVDGTSTAGSASKIFSGVNNIIRSNIYATGHQGVGFVQSIGGLQGLTSKSITASKLFASIGTLTDVLEIDWEHDEYETNGTILSIIASAGTTSSANPVYGRNIRLHAVGGNITLNTFDATLRPTSNIIGANGTVILAGNYLDLTIDNDHVFMTGTTVMTPTLAVGNGVTKVFKGVLADFILDPTVILNIAAGAVIVNSDVDGVFDDPDVVGFVDYWTGKYEFRFTDPVPDLTNIVLTYNKPNTWKNTGAWVI